MCSQIAKERELVARAKTGDREAFDHLVLLHQRWMFLVALRIVRNKEDAREAVQESLLYIWRNLSRHDPERGRIGAILHHTVWSRSIDRLRSRMGRAGRVFVELEENLLPNRELIDLEQSVELAERKHLIHTALQLLSPEDQTVIRLFEFEGVDSREIGRRLGCSRDTVNVRLSRARTRLRKRLAQVV